MVITGNSNNANKQLLFGAARPLPSAQRRQLEKCPPVFHGAQVTPSPSAISPASVRGRVLGSYHHQPGRSGNQTGEGCGSPALHIVLSLVLPLRVYLDCTLSSGLNRAQAPPLSPFTMIGGLVLVSRNLRWFRLSLTLHALHVRTYTYTQKTAVTTSIYSGVLPGM